MGNKKSPQNHTDLDDLISELSNSDPSRRRKARYELIVQGDAAVLLLNQTLLTSFSKNARKEAAKALGEIGNSDAVYALIKALEDQNFEVRWDAAEGLIALGNTCLIPLCHELIRNF